MTIFITKYEKGKTPLEEFIIQEQRRRKTREVFDLIGFKTEVTDTYKEWLKNNLTETLFPSPNMPTQVVDVYKSIRFNFTYIRISSKQVRFHISDNPWRMFNQASIERRMKES